MQRTQEKHTADIMLQKYVKKSACANINVIK